MSGLLAGEPTPVLGPAGIGKSTICLQALHDPRVAKRFGARRYFVRCDACTSAEALMAQMGTDLSLKASPDVSANVQRHLAEAPAALVLDNLETPWDQEQLETEEVLKQISSIENLALAATIRGSSRPFGVAWRDALQVTPLSGDDPKRLFLAIAGAKHEKDPHLSRLLAALDGMPLAIELMAHAAEAEPDLEGVWRRWNEQRTEMLKRGKGDQRLLSLAVSLALSMRSPRMTDPARRLLSMLSLLPNGIARGHVNTLVPDHGYAAAAVLRQLALAFDEGGRLRCLSPIREYISRSHPPSMEDYGALLDYQGSAAWERYDKASERIKKYLQKQKYSLSRHAEKEIVALIELAFYETCNVYENTKNLMRHGASVFRSLNMADAEADATFALGRLSRGFAAILDHAKLANVQATYGDARALYDDAQERAEKALSLYRGMGDAHGEARCNEELNRIVDARSKASRDRHADKRLKGPARAVENRTRPAKRM